MAKNTKKSSYKKLRTGRRGAATGNAAGATRVQIYGTHAVEAALDNPARTVHALHVADNAMARLGPAIERRGVSPRKVGLRDLDHMLGRDVVHQGVLLETGPLPELDLMDFLESIAAEDLTATSAPLLVLDQVTDPHNVGAILRSAAAFGARALIMTKRNSPPLSGTLAKSASGGLEYIPIIHVTNLVRALEMIGNAGYERIGLEGSGQYGLEDETGTRPIALVLGAEDKGMRRLTREVCDRICNLSTGGPLKSLNVSNASAVALHTVQHLRGRK